MHEDLKFFGTNNQQDIDYFLIYERDLLCSSYANSLPFNIVGLKADIGLDIETKILFGLDPATRKLIEGMPEKIRKEFIQALVDGLPLIDNSIHSYLEKIDQIAFDSIEQTRCSASGLIQQIPDFRELILGIKPTPINDLDKRYNMLEEKFKKDSSPQFYRVQYIEYIASADKTACQFRPKSEPWNFVTEYSSKTLNRFNICNRLNEKCQNLYDCYDKLYQDINIFLEKSNPKI